MASCVTRSKLRNTGLTSACYVDIGENKCKTSEEKIDCTANRGCDEKTGVCLLNNIAAATTYFCAEITNLASCVTRSKTRKDNGMTQACVVKDGACTASAAFGARAVAPQCGLVPSPSWGARRPGGVLVSLGEGA